ncbi:YaaA family protein [Ornithinimicrobium avium]|uniref:Peroxide stress protein YaaA n=1 Tax=Ornithinimicrobium avium TaxID=2283195 RepID=A0A345NS13_9MICO|nr:peroxide stress protein YaaA [Ornithinimicrobium avium]AXH97821.1 peroxide stress protein YaaA [Ornithinimicrobium avium]
MLVLLPPSESKATRARGAALRPGTLSWPSLAPQRARVAEALAAVSARPDAAQVLGVSPNLTEEVARNTRLLTAPTLPARDLYTGVLYDALDLAWLDAAASRRASRRLVVVSALYGAVRMTDRLAPYRLSMAVNLPGVGPLSTAWRPHLEEVLPSAVGRGLVVDCRSSTYAAAWVPQGALAHRWVTVQVPGATHMAKHTRGLVARALCRVADDPRRPEALVDLLASQGFDAELHPPARAGRPWVLDVQPA